jgi:purine-nucleoside phosphorylase
MTHHDWNHVQEASQAVRTRWSGAPRVGIVLGTGLGALAHEIEAEAILPYSDIPHFPRSTVESHKGQLVCGTLAGHSVMAMEGRFHLYEGYTAAQVTFPIRVMKELGCRYLIVSNACGGLNPLFRKGDLMVIEDHINLLGHNPLIGPNDERLGPRFPDMIEPYDRALQAIAMQAALDEKVPIQRGVYAAMTGPNLETRAEYRFLRAIGADVIGMSTIPEVIVAVHCGLRTLGFSIVTDMCLADALKPVSIEEIIAVANEAELKLRTIVRRVLGRLET